MEKLTFQLFNNFVSWTISHRIFICFLLPNRFGPLANVTSKVALTSLFYVISRSAIRGGVSDGLHDGMSLLLLLMGNYQSRLGNGPISPRSAHILPYLE